MINYAIIIIVSHISDVLKKQKRGIRYDQTHSKRHLFS